MRLLRKLIFKIISLVIIVTILIFISNCFRAVIPSTSMFPLLDKGDQLLIKKTGVQNIKRGDIIVFYKEDTLYIKRAIGLPGENVYIENGAVYINGCLLKEDYVVNNDNFCGQFSVPEESYFVLGDNRVNSNDSRYWINPYISANAVVGKAIIKFYPLNEVEIIKGVQYEVY